MFKQTARSATAIYLAWNVLEFVLHGVILKSTYLEMTDLWRPLDEWKYGVGQMVMAVSAIAFTLLYVRLIGNKCMRSALCYGFLFGIMGGAVAGYGAYSAQPIPHHVALTLFFAKIIKMTLAGLIVGLTIRSQVAETSDA